MNRCPLCYHPSKTIKENKNFYLQCQSEYCLLCGPIGETENQAIKRFNNRIQNYNDVEDVCVFCGKGEFIIEGSFRFTCKNCKAKFPTDANQDLARERINDRI